MVGNVKDLVFSWVLLVLCAQLSLILKGRTVGVQLLCLHGLCVWIRRTWKVDRLQSELTYVCPSLSVSSGTQSLPKGLREERARVGLLWSPGLLATESGPQQPRRQAWGACTGWLTGLH